MTFFYNNFIILADFMKFHSSYISRYENNYQINKDSILIF